MADINNNEIIQIIDDLKEHRFNIENRTVLYTETSDNSGQGLPYALNEVAILKQDLSSMIRINTTVNGEYLHTYEADGLIIATPTGSTAYALSVGGPIMVPEAENFIIAPVATHSLSVRPLIIPDQWSVELSIDSRSQSYLISLDGRSQLMPTTTKITIKKADYNGPLPRGLKARGLGRKARGSATSGAFWVSCSLFIFPLAVFTEEGFDASFKGIRYL